MFISTPPYFVQETVATLLGDFEGFVCFSVPAKSLPATSYQDFFSCYRGGPLKAALTF